MHLLALLGVWSASVAPLPNAAVVPTPVSRGEAATTTTTAAAATATATASAHEGAHPPGSDLRDRAQTEVSALVGGAGYGVCVARHFSRWTKADLCVSGDGKSLTTTSHAFVWKTWSLATTATSLGPELRVGPGVGVVSTAFCPYSTCLIGIGGEALASVELVSGLARGVRFTLQGDAGLAVVWELGAPGSRPVSLRFPARLVAGILF